MRFSTNDETMQRLSKFLRRELFERPSDDALNAIVKLTRLKVLRIGGENTDLDAGMLIEIAQSMNFLTYKL